MDKHRLTEQLQKFSVQPIYIAAKPFPPPACNHGTGQLAGLTGTMTIEIDSTGKHSYVFEYALPEPR